MATKKCRAEGVTRHRAASGPSPVDAVSRVSTSCASARTAVGYVPSNSRVNTLYMTSQGQAGAVTYMLTLLHSVLHGEGYTPRSPNAGLDGAATDDMWITSNGLTKMR